tara:strand:- start:48944 stop:49351 length:408 start_codon:yes stop_codon:yes gene_type:complete
MIGNSNQMMTESAIENRLTYEMQERATNVQQFIEVELTKVRKVISEKDSALIYTTVTADTIELFKDKSELIVKNKNTGELKSIAARLDKLEFEYLPNSTFINVSLTTKSKKEDSVNGKSEYIGLSERRYYLRNLL